MSTFIIFFGASTALLMALRLLVSSFKIRDFLIFGFFLCSSMVLYYYAMMTSNILLLYPQLFALDFPAATLMVATFYLYMTVLLNPTRKFNYWRLLHLLPGLVALAITAPVFWADETVKFEMVKTLYSQYNNQNPDYLLGVLPVLAAVSYVMLTLIEVYKSKISKKEEPVDLGFVVLMICGFIAIFAIVSLAVFSLSIFLIKAASISASLLLLSWFLIAQMKPQILQSVVNRINTKKYNRTYLKGQNIKALKKKLATLMIEEKLFTSPDISVKTMAEELGLSSHQVSELLNKHLQKRFNQYVNEFRIEEAKKLLLKDCEASVFSIGYKVGFSTPSMFNSVFRDIAGMTPKQFRDKSMLTLPAMKVMAS